MLSREFSSITFIGRGEEIALFESMLNNPQDPAWILSLVGPGGQGKTQLLTRFVEIARSRSVNGQDVLVTATPIDFCWTAHQRELGVLVSLATQLECKDEFSKFQAQVDRYGALLSQKLAPEQLKRSTLEARALFLEGYRELSKEKRIVLLFDTAESAAGVALDRFWQETLPALRPNTLVVIAGRKQYISVLPEEGAIQKKISGFSTEEIADYLKKQEITASNKVVSRIVELSEGRPILVALIVDWVNNGHALNELLDYHTPTKFKKAMVGYVHGLRHPEEQAILVMAYLYKRFNEEILEQVLDLPIEASDLILNLKRFTFIKYSPGVGGAEASCLLHDEMRNLVKKYVWPAADPLGEYRRELSTKIINYYAAKIEETNNPLERQDLDLERLYYWFDVNVQEAFTFSSDLFERAYRSGDRDLMSSVNKVLKHYDKRLLPEMTREFEFRTVVEKHHWNKFDETLETLERYAEVSEQGLLEAKSLARLVSIYATRGESEMALDRGRQCEVLCNTLLEQAQNESERGRIEQTRRLLYNNLGYTWRHALGNLDRAIEYYDKVLHSPGIEGELYLLARTRNNKAFAYARKGRLNEAKSLGEDTLDIRIHLINDPAEVGLSYNVLGTIYAAMDQEEDAIKAFEQAFEQFDKAESEWRKGFVYVAYGKLLRKLGWQEETGELKSVIDGVRQLLPDEGENSETRISQNEKYQKAHEFFEAAESIFAREESWADMSETLNEMGCLYRQVDDTEKAIACFEKSINFARKLKNKFREGDNLLDIAIAYYRTGDLSQARKYAVRAKTIARKHGHDYLFGKTQHLLAAVAFNEGDHNRAFEFFADACVFVVRQRSQAQAYFDVLDSISFYLRQLSSAELVRNKTQYLIDRWQRERLTERYPGFKLRMETIAQDYLLWATG